LKKNCLPSFSEICHAIHQTLWRVVRSNDAEFAVGKWRIATTFRKWHQISGIRRHRRLAPVVQARIAGERRRRRESAKTVQSGRKINWRRHVLLVVIWLYFVDEEIRTNRELKIKAKHKYLNILNYILYKSILCLLISFDDK